MLRRDALRILGTGTLGLAGAGLFGSRPTQSSTAPPRNTEEPRIRTRPIPSSGEEVPVIGLGTWRAFDVGSDAAERKPLGEVLTAFVTAGGKLIDSSPMYGRSEEVIGDLVSKLGLRPKLFLATKVWTTGKAKGLEQVRESMRKLRAQTLDLEQVHNLVDAKNHLDALEEWKKEGKVRYVGITHYTASAHDELAQVLASRKVDFVQVNYSVSEREAERRVLPLARERGVAVIANRPFAAGDLLRSLRTKPLPPWAREIDCESWAQLLLKFVISHPAITCAIPATSNPAHLRDNMKGGVGRLADEATRNRIATEILG